MKIDENKQLQFCKKDDITL